MTTAPAPNLFEPHYEPDASGEIRLRRYQNDAIDAIEAAFNEANSTLLVLPTGCGKTITFAELIRRRLSGTDKRAMVLAHREELIHQAADKIEQVTGDRPDIEMASYWAGQRGQLPVVVSSIDTQQAGRDGGRKLRFDPHDFDLVIVDEAHHAIADSYVSVLGHYLQNSGCKLLGVTATPDRGDEQKLGKVFETVAYDYEIHHAIRDGWLVPIRQRSVTVDDLDYSKVKTTAGELNQKDLAGVLEQERVLHEMTRPTYELADGRKTLIFTAAVSQAERVCEILNRYEPHCARWVSGETPKDDRRQILADYHAGQFQFLCNVGVFTEGFDEPSIEVISLMRPTKSRALFAQMVGRGTRVLPGIVDGVIDDGSDEAAKRRREAIAASEKPSLEVIDFQGNAGKHKLMTVADVLGTDEHESVVERAKQLADQAVDDESQSPDMSEKLDEARQQISEEERQRREQLERERQKERERRADVVAQAQYSVRDIDPFNLLDIEPPTQRGWDREREPTPRMLSFLRSQGVPSPEAMSFSEAHELINKLKKRQQHGWCSFKQAQSLAMLGYENPKGVRAKDAAEIIQQVPECEL